MSRDEAIKAAEAVSGSYVRARELVDTLIALGLLKLDKPPIKG